MAQCKLLFVNVTRLVFAVSGQAGVDVDRAGVGAVRNVMAAGETHSQPTNTRCTKHAHHVLGGRERPWLSACGGALVASQQDPLPD